MGIRYYAYAVDAELADAAVADPFSILSRDPLADAWGLEPHTSVSVATFEQVRPQRDMLYLDKAWGPLQAITRPIAGGGSARAAFRMFDGRVTMHDDGWDPWVRTILPDEVPAIRDDVCGIGVSELTAWAKHGPHGRDAEEELNYVLGHLRRAQEFVVGLVADGRGMVYLIG